MSKTRSRTTGISLVLCALLNSAALGDIASARDLQETQPNGQPDYLPLIEELKVKIPELMAQRSTPGLAIAFVDGDRLVWSQGFGFSDNSRKTAVTADTLFSVQSISKTYTATGVLIAASRATLTLDDPLTRYLPGFTVKSRFGDGDVKKMTFRHLLSHRAGLPVEAPLGNNFDNCSCTFDEHVKSISDSWLIAPVGDRYHYSNAGADLAGYVLGLQARTSFAEFMKDELLAPLGMTATTFNQREALQHPSFAKGHVGDRELPDIAVPMVPSGGMYSSANDMARFLSFHLSGGTVNGKRLISEALLREMYTPQFAVPGQVAGYGLGVSVLPWHGGTFVYHAGGGYGYSAQRYWMPDYQIGVVVLSNAQSGSLTSDIADRVMLKMIEAKRGSVPPSRPFEPSTNPIVTVEPQLLRRLEGTYKARFNLVTFRFEDDGLYQVSGTTRTKLIPQSPTELTLGNRRLVFRLDGKGQPLGVLILSASETEYLPFNDSPNDSPGLNKSAWQAHLGEYQGNLYGNAVSLRIFVKNGHLYATWQGDLKLAEFQPGLFFTSEGESVVFQGNRLSFGNRPFVKK